MTKDMTAGKPLGLILRFCGPMVFGNILQQLYSMVDTVIVVSIPLSRHLQIWQTEMDTA